ncbi:DNA ligase [Marinobacter hydrocarbonoclasticus]|uniref:DNA ligase n=1 Tax=Marinobacter nauticus TaxID=2743 RepID=UPI001A9065CB|nr:DNA ligase [Marinobacter nauticus]MBN8239637.1 DNA ligase [Marinobacter nauticus]
MPLCNTTRVRAMPLAFSFIVVSIFLSAFGHASGRPPALPLANVYHPGVNLEEYWVSEKLDGVRAYWDGETLWSRGGHRYTAPALFTRQFPAHPLDGELWSGRGRFAELSGVVRKVQPVDQEWRQVRFHVFDLPEADVPFEQRYRRLQKLLAAADSRYLVLVEQRVVASHEELMARLQQTVAAGGEGLMLKRRKSLYQAGRSDDLLKVKSHQDAEATVVAHLPGKGKYEGLLGALEVELESGRRFRLGTGFTDEERRNPPAIGARVTFRYRGLTATGLPRFASFLRIRNDEPESIE